MSIVARNVFCRICGGTHPIILKDIYGTTCPNELLIIRGNKTRKRGGVVYFIEHKETGLWWYKTNNFLTNKNIWTDNPMKCFAFPSYDDAERVRILCNGYYNKTFVTEHKFLN